MIKDGVGTNGSGPYKEDNEAEPGMVQSQAWDLEGFFIDGKKLTIVGGYNFYTGKVDGSKTLTAGDIFIDHNGDAVYAPNTITIPGFDYNPGYQAVSNSFFKYDYVLDVNWIAGTFDIVKLNENSILKDTEYGATYNKPSNPWKYLEGGVVKYSGSFNTYGKTSQSNTGFDDWVNTDGYGQHYVATFDLSAIGDDIYGSLIHNTMECGNDNLLGRTPVPEPATMILFGAGLVGITAVVRRKRS